MSNVVQFNKKPFVTRHGVSHQIRPTDKEMEASHDMIMNDTWHWEFNATVFFRISDSNYTEEDIRKLCAAEFPMVDEEDDTKNSLAFNMAVYSTADREIEGINEHLHKIEGDWEICLCMDYFLEDDYLADRPRIIEFIESLKDVQWQLDTSWVDVT